MTLGTEQCRSGLFCGEEEKHSLVKVWSIDQSGRSKLSLQGISGETKHMRVPVMGLFVMCSPLARLISSCLVTEHSPFLCAYNPGC